MQYFLIKVQTERIHWIDIARGIGIIFIIYAHVLGSHDFRYLFYAFHIPLFLFLSGAVFKPYESFITFIKKSFKGLLIPYFIIAFISYIVWTTRITNYQLFGSNEIKQFLSIFYGNSNNGLISFNNVLWFLPTLFATRIIFFPLHKFLKTKFLILALFIISILGYLYSILFPFIKLPFGTETAISVVVFYGAGFIWISNKKAKAFIFKNKMLIFLFFLIIGSLLSTFDFNMYGHQIDMRLLHLNNYFLFYIDAFAGVFAWIAFSMFLQKNNFLEYLGKNSLILFAWHTIIFDYLRVAQNLILNKQLFETLKILIPAIYTAISITIILIVNYLYKKIKLLFKMLPKPNSE